MKKQLKTEPGRKLTILRSSELLRVLGGNGYLKDVGGGGGPPPGGSSTPEAHAP